MKGLKEKYNKEIAPALQKKFGYKNKMAVPKITKVIVSTGIGSQKDDARKEAIEKQLSMIVGQKLLKNKAKTSIAPFKLRKGMVIGYSATLRNKRMYDFLEKLINVAMPRIRDFRGLVSKSIDSMGNLSIGIKEHIVFPEAGEEDVRNAFGVGITITTTAKSKEEAEEFFRLLGFPFKKD